MCLSDVEKCFADGGIKNESHKGSYEISCARHHNPSFLARSNLSAEKILFIDGKVYLFGLDKSSFKKNGEIRDVVCQIFKRTSTGLELEGQIRIPCRCHVIDVDPLTKNVVLQEGQDPPFTSIFWLFNLTTEKMVKIYLSDYSGHPIFLREDILRIDK